MLVLLGFMGIQVYRFFLGHDFLLAAGITIAGPPDLNILYTTASRLVAMIGVTVFVMVTQNPAQYLGVLYGKRPARRPGDVHRPALSLRQQPGVAGDGFWHAGGDRGAGDRRAHRRLPGISTSSKP